MIVIPQSNLKSDPYEVRGLSVDYATNTVNGFIGKEEVILYELNDLGIRLDNRYHGHRIEIRDDVMVILTKG